jgi:hypothetical protein
MESFSHGPVVLASEKVTIVDWLRPDGESEWDAFVTTHRFGLVYHLSSWKRVLETAFPHITGKFLVARNGISGEIVAGIPVYSVKSWLLGNRIVSVPFATMCDPLVSGADEFDLFLPALRELQQKTKSRRVEIRARKSSRFLSQNAALRGDVDFKHLYISLERDRDTLFRTFSRTSIRKNITKANNSGVVVDRRSDGAAMKLCYDILCTARRRNSLPQIPFAFFQAMLDALSPDHMSPFLAFHNGKAVGCFIMMNMGDLWTAEYVGVLDDAPPGVDQLLYWESIKYAHDRGGKIYSFGRTAVANEGLLTYKRRWAPMEEDLVDFTFCARGGKTETVEMVHHTDASLVYRTARAVFGKLPMPAYRLIGDFCYRHLG